jgi:hypothetical protein
MFASAVMNLDYSVMSRLGLCSGTHRLQAVRASLNATNWLRQEVWPDLFQLHQNLACFAVLAVVAILVLRT